MGDFSYFVVVAASRGLFFQHSPAAHVAVTTCLEAAAARGIELKRELKSILLDTSVGPKMVHVPGDKRVCLRAVKKALTCEQAHLMAPSELGQMSTEAGTICPFLAPFWSLEQLICRQLLGDSTVFTNDGTHVGYIEFSPALLTTAQTHIVGRFSD